MSANNLFGPIVTGRDVRVAVESHLKRWLPTYLAEVCRISGRDSATVPGPRSWVSALEMPDGRYEEHQIPSCVIVAPGLLSEPRRDSRNYRATWAVAVGCVVSSRTREETFELAEVYAASVRAAVLHKPSLGGFAEGVDWIGERYDDIPNDMLRTLAAGTVQFAVEIAAALEVGAGPDSPLPNPTLDPGERATFVSVSAEIEGVSS